MSMMHHSTMILAAAIAPEPVINITDRSITGTRGFGETGLASRAGIRLVNTGQLQTRINGSFSNVGSEWQNPVGGLTPGDYDVSWVRVSGAPASAIHGGLVETTQYNLGTTRDIYLENPNEVSIWPAAGGARVDFAQFTLNATNVWI